MTLASPPLAVSGGPGEGRSGRARSRRAGVALVLGALVAVVLLRAFVAAPMSISSSSMAPTLEHGDVVLVSRGTDLGDLHRGDLVAFASPADGAQTLKRVVGLPGDTVVIRDAVLYVDEQPVEEPYVDHEAIDAYYSALTTVPDGTVYVLGDNRANSVDSRAFGPVPAADLHGKVLLRLWPPLR